MIPIGLGFRAVKAGGAVVGVTIHGAGPRVVLSTFLATAGTDDGLAREPYRIAAGMMRTGGIPADAAAAVAEGRRRQAATAATGLGGIGRQLAETGHRPLVAALLVNRAGWVTDLLEYSLAWPEHVPVAEGLAVRDALRHAIDASGLDRVELDEKSLPACASQALGLSPADLDSTLKTLGATAGQPWRKEQKLACLAAWTALAARR